MFIIKPEEVKELEGTIKRVAKEIKSLSFWDSYCSDLKCPYCRLRKIMHK